MAQARPVKQHTHTSPFPPPFSATLRPGDFTPEPHGSGQPVSGRDAELELEEESESESESEELELAAAAPSWEATHGQSRA